MKPVQRVLLYSGILLLAAGLTMASARYIRPAQCLTLCNEPPGAPCPAGSCRFGEQRAGFPLPFWIDNEGGSPTIGWGKLGPEDFPNPFTFILDVGFYAILLWFLWQAAAILRGIEKLRALRTAAPLLGLALLCLLVGLLTDPSVRQRLSIGLGGQETLVGKWLGEDTASGATLTLRIYPSGMISITLTGYPQPIGGMYTLEEAGKLRLHFDGSKSAKAGEAGICTSFPTFLRDVCRSRLVNPASVDPASYPGPIEVVPQLYPGPAVPVPTREPVVISQINSLFEARLDGDTLTLISPSGAAQTFQRVRGR